MSNFLNYITFSFVFLIFLQAKTCEEAQPQESDTTEVGKSESITNSPLEKVHLRRYGGMMGHEENLIVTQDSTIYTFKNRDIQMPKRLSIATPTDKWNMLIQLFDENELSQLQDGEMKVAFDGIDNVYVVEGDFKTQTVRNPTENPTGLNAFFDYINTERTTLFDQIRKE